MRAPASPPARVRFGPFELDRERKELLEDCKPVHIPEQQMTLLLLLTGRMGALVTRQQVKDALWPDGTFVDFERGINTAVRRLRVALREEGDEARYIATVPGRGYRFLTPKEQSEETGAAAASAAPVRAPAARRPRRWWLATAAAAVLALGSAGWVWARLEPPPEVLGIRALTTDGGLDLPARPASYGPLIYYLDRAGSHWNLMSSNGNPASARVVPMPFPSTRLISISSDGTEWLLGSFRQRGEEEALWKQAQPGGAPVRLGDLRAYDAVWDPDGVHIEYSSGQGLWQAASDGSGAHELAAGLPVDPDWLNWSPDGRRLRFFSGSQLWEWRPGERARALPFRLPRCCGAWSRDGRYFFFSAEENGLWTIWAERTGEPWPWRLFPALRPRPVPLISLPRGSYGAYTGFGRRQLVFYQLRAQPDPERCGPEMSHCRPLLPGRSALQLRFSPDGRRIAYVDTRDYSIWTADIGPGFAAGNFRQLSPPGVIASQPSWSGDGRWVAYSGGRPGALARAWRVEASGGPADPLVPGASANAAYEAPAWAPDGERVALNQNLGGRHHIVILSAGHLQTVAGSEPMNTPRWSPDGRWLSGISSDQRQVAVFSFALQRWHPVAQGQAFSIPQWSPDGRYLYFQDLLAEGEPLFRAQVGEWKPEKVADCSALLHEGVHRCAFMGLTPDGEMMISLNGSSGDLYAATLQLP